MLLNKHRDDIPSDAIYIGRGSKWGNPFVIGKDGTRDEVCDMYHIWIKNEILAGRITLQELADLHNKNLVCFCVPKRCHGLTLEKAAQWAFSKLNGIPYS